MKRKSPQSLPGAEAGDGVVVRREDPKPKPKSTTIDPKSLSKDDIKALLAQFQVVTPEEIKVFEARSQEWLADNSKFHDWSLDRMYLYLQILDRIATNPPPGRSAGMLVLNAIKDVREQVYTLVELLVELRAKKGGGRTA